jgi:hypothetical protein
MYLCQMDVSTKSRFTEKSTTEFRKLRRFIPKYGSKKSHVAYYCPGLKQ